MMQHARGVVGDHSRASQQTAGWGVGRAPIWSTTRAVGGSTVARPPPLVAAAAAAGAAAARMAPSMVPSAACSGRLCRRQ